MSGLREALAEVGLTGPYELRWPTEQGGMFSVWGTGWAIPLVASGTETPMRALCDYLNAAALSSGDDAGTGLRAKRQPCVHGDPCRESQCTEYGRFAAPPAPDSMDALDVAWREAEAACPEGWVFHALTRRPDVALDVSDHDESKRWQAAVWAPSPDEPAVLGRGPSPTESLRALARALREQGSSGE